MIIGLGESYNQMNLELPRNSYDHTWKIPELPWMSQLHLKAVRVTFYLDTHCTDCWLRLIIKVTQISTLIVPARETLPKLWPISSELGICHPTQLSWYLDSRGLRGMKLIFNDVCFITRGNLQIPAGIWAGSGLSETRNDIVRERQCREKSISEGLYAERRGQSLFFDFISYD